MNIYEEGLRLLQENKSFVVASIINSTGSTPRSKGTQMIIREDGSIFATVGGGKMEASCIENGIMAIKNKKSFTYKFNLSNKDAYKSEMVCGGSGEILINYIDSEDENNLLIFQKAVQTVKKHKKGWVVTVLRGDKRELLFIDDENNMIGQYTGSQLMKNKLQNGVERLSIHSDAIDDERFIVQKVHSMGKAFIFGAGHVSKETAAILDLIEFETTVIDDREEFANTERFPSADKVICKKFNEALEEINYDNNSYFVVVTRGHRADQICIESILNKEYKYLGMIGSKAKVANSVRQLVEKGYSSKEIEKIHAPIGLNIGAQTPAEIAISIAAQIIEIKNKSNLSNVEMFSANIGYGLSGFVLAIKCFHTGSDSAPDKV